MLSLCASWRGNLCGRVVPVMVSGSGSPAASSTGLGPPKGAAPVVSAINENVVLFGLGEGAVILWTMSVPQVVMLTCAGPTRSSIAAVGELLERLAAEVVPNVAHPLPTRLPTAAVRS